MSKIQRFEDLEAWKISREVTKEVYRVSVNEKFIRDFGLRDQICRASVRLCRTSPKVLNATVI